MIRGEREGYVVECCVSTRERVCEAEVRRRVAWDGGREAAVRKGLVEGGGAKLVESEFGDAMEHEVVLK